MFALLANNFAHKCLECENELSAKIKNHRYGGFNLGFKAIVPTGNRTYPRYFRIEFVFNRAKYTSQPRPIDRAKIELQAKVIELRSRGWSYPAIAKRLDISVGTAWNMAKLEDQD